MLAQNSDVNNAHCNSCFGKYSDEKGWGVDTVSSCLMVAVAQWRVLLQLGNFRESYHKKALVIKVREKRVTSKRVTAS